MSVFRRRRDQRDAAADQTDAAGPDVEDVEDVEDGEDLEAAGDAAAARPSVRDAGPWDVSEVDDPADGRVSLGGLWIPGVEGLEVRVEADQASGAVIAVTLLVDDSALQLQPFAAPRSEGIWAEVRREIMAGITQQGGTADEVEGPLGPELRTRVPMRRPDGSSVVEPARFVGVDGPRWFLRGVLTGRAAVEPGADATLLQLFRDVVVVRGSGPMAPRDPIPLQLPTELGGQAEGETASQNPLDPFERGPEITEIR